MQAAKHVQRAFPLCKHLSHGEPKCMRQTGVCFPFIARPGQGCSRPRFCTARQASNGPRPTKAWTVTFGMGLGQTGALPGTQHGQVMRPNPIGPMINLPKGFPVALPCLRILGTGFARIELGGENAKVTSFCTMK
jgi:hypothetical protein